MIHEISVVYDDDRKINGKAVVKIGKPNGRGDAWEDLGLLLEGVGVLVGACANEGKTEHNGQSVENYLKDYIGKVCNDYQTVKSLSN